MTRAAKDNDAEVANAQLRRELDAAKESNARMQEQLRQIRRLQGDAQARERAARAELMKLQTASDPTKRTSETDSDGAVAAKLATESSEMMATAVASTPRRACVSTS